MQVSAVPFVFFSIFYHNTKAEETQFSFLRQSEYDVKLEMAKADSFNSSYLKYGKLDAVPYNRTYRVLNCSFETRLDLTKQIVIAVETYKFLSNEYRFFPATFEFDVCTEYTHDSFGLKQLFDRVSNLNPCFVKKDVQYRIVNALADYSKWPPHIPLGRYRLNINLMHKTNRNSIAALVVQIEIKEKPKNWKL